MNKKDFASKLKKLTEIYPDSYNYRVFEGTILDHSKNPIFVELKTALLFQNTTNRVREQYAYAQIGDRFFIDNKLEKLIPDSLKTDPRIIRLNDLDRYFQGVSHFLEQVVAITAVDSLDLKNKSVLNVSNKEGLLSLIANLNGANVKHVGFNYDHITTRITKRRSCFLLENALVTNNFPMSNIKTYGHLFDDDYDNNFEFLKNLEGPNSEQKTEVLIIGYEQSPLKGTLGMRIILDSPKLFPNLKTIIGTNYFDTNEYGSQNYSSRILSEKLAALGFNDISYIRYSEEKPLVSIIAKKE